MSGNIVDDHHEAVCYRKLVGLLHPGGLACPQCGSGRAVESAPGSEECVPHYDCPTCGRSFNAWTGTLLQGAGSPPSEMLAELLEALENVVRRGRIRRPLTGSRRIFNPESSPTKHSNAGLLGMRSSPDLP
jgi:transposase-like protein